VARSSDESPDLLITKIQTWGISAGLIGLVWEAVSKDSPLRTVVLQLTKTGANKDSIMLGGDVPVEFGADVLSLAMGRMRVVDDSLSASGLRAMIEEDD
jgi:hypothetical protein